MSWRTLPLAVRVKRGRWPAIWLPLIVLWPLVIALLCLALPLWLLVPTPRRSLTELLVASYRTLCAAHGAEFELNAAGKSSWNFLVY